MFTIAASRRALRAEEQRTHLRRDSAGGSNRTTPLSATERAEVQALLTRLEAAGFTVIAEPRDSRWFVHRADLKAYVGDALDAARLLDQAAARAARPTREGMTATPAQCIVALRAVGYDVKAAIGSRYQLVRDGMLVRTLDLNELRRMAYPGPTR